MECRYCEAKCHKKGVRNGIQCYRCTICRKYQKKHYSYQSYVVSDKVIASCVREGVGIRSMSRLLGIASGTVIRRIQVIASRITKPPIPMNKIFEVDELFTFIGSKQKRVCVVLALERESGFPVDYYIGPRTQRTLRMVTNTLLASGSKLIYTDKLSHYVGLIPSWIHKTNQYGTNRVERFNLSVRTHLKRLNRRSIAFSRSLKMLRSCLIIYLWG